MRSFKNKESAKLTYVEFYISPPKISRLIQGVLQYLYDYSRTEVANIKTVIHKWPTIDLPPTNHQSFPICFCRDCLASDSCSVSLQQVCRLRSQSKQIWATGNSERGPAGFRGIHLSRHIQMSLAGCWPHPSLGSDRLNCLAIISAKESQILKRWFRKRV